MRRFNPEKELDKLQHNNKKKVILSVLALLLIIAIGSSYALYQVRYTKRVIYTKVGEINKDINIAVYLNNEKQDDFPKKNEGYKYKSIYCKNGSQAKFDNINWKLVLEVDAKDKCDVYFESSDTIPNAPELYQGLIPIVIDNSGVIRVADGTTEWYNYDEHKWANAVLVDNANYSKYVKDGVYVSNAVIPMDNILQMYVWIPRFKYKLFNVNNDLITEQEIKIKFEQGTSSTGDITCKYSNLNNGEIKEECTNKEGLEAKNGDWYTHPAFKFGNTELTGFWVGKFENGGTQNEIFTKPDINSIHHNMLLGDMFTAVRNIEIQNYNKYNLNPNEIDTHMMKNMEWGAVAYLTNSIYGRYIDETTCVAGGCETWMNNVTAYITGCAASPSNTEGKPFIESQIPTCEAENKWNGTYGPHASTTDNISGIYDMSGGAWEYVMGNAVSLTGAYEIGTSTLDMPDSKYYDVYSHSDSYYTYDRGHLGDATRETIKQFNRTDGAWYGDFARFPSSSSPWFLRSGYNCDTSGAGVFYFYEFGGNEIGTCRTVISAEDK